MLLTQTNNIVRLYPPAGGSFVAAAPYSYDVQAIDPDNDLLTYSLVNNPAGMTINPSTGLISWVPPGPSDPSLPSVDGFSVQKYASLVDPMGLAFDPSGVLFVGDGQGNLPKGDPNAPIRRVGIGGTPVQNFSQSGLTDPELRCG